ncbi:MAG: tetratricopeptide repeat protein [Acidobacteria bacterium]|nr:tetratricopeptide repeat protein [Acidobacteriota bacterium]
MKEGFTLEPILDAELSTLIEKTKREPDNAELLAQISFECSLRRMNEEAMDYAKRALELDPQRFDASWELINAYALLDLPLEELVEGYQQEAIKHPEKVEPFLKLGLIYHYLGEEEEAGEMVEKVRMRDKNNPRAHEIVGLLAYSREEFDKAIAELQEAAKALPDPRVHLMLGHSYFEKGELDKSALSYRKSVEINKNFAPGWLGLARLLLSEEENFPLARRLISQSLMINPRFFEAYFTLADYYLGHKKYYQAIACYLSVVELSPPPFTLAEAHTEAGYLFSLLSQDKLALHHYSLANKADPDYPLAYHHSGTIFLKNKEYRKAERSFQKAIELAPDFPWPYTKLGFTYLERENYNKAEEYFRKALELDPEEYWAYLGLADVARKRGDVDAQLSYSLKAKELAEEDSDVRNYLGIAYECKKDYLAAIAEYERALELDPYNRSAANNLGFLYEKLMEETQSQEFKEKAIKAWRQRLLICRDTSQSTEGAINHLKKLGVDEATIEKWLASGDINRKGHR